jgi:hypothetical protein
MFTNLTKGLYVLDHTAPEGKDRTLREWATEMHDLLPTTALSMKHGLIYFSMYVRLKSSLRENDFANAIFSTIGDKFPVRL